MIKQLSSKMAFAFKRVLLYMFASAVFVYVCRGCLMAAAVLLCVVAVAMSQVDCAAVLLMRACRGHFSS